MVSRMVTNRQKLSKDLMAWAETHAGALSQALSAVGGAFAIGGPALVAMAQAVNASLDALVAADEAHGQEQADDVLPRVDRDEARDMLSDQLLSLRRIVEAAYGRAGMLALGLNERLSYDPVFIQRMAQRVVDAIKVPSFQMPAGDPDVSVDVPKLVAKLTAPLAKLSAALAKVDTEAAELTTTQAAKDAAMATFDARFTALTGILRGLAQLAGRPELADALPVLNRGSGGAGQAEPEVVPEEGPG